ncbi:MAG: hypothetical protein E6G64_17500 [Actinobacteria bacterium]|nr:MAG: hypothetical protein E6G64_17500 [Actinomycetota bacterium]
MRRERERQWLRLTAFTVIWVVTVGIWIWARLTASTNMRNDMTDVLVIGLRSLVDQSIVLVVIAAPFLAGLWVVLARRERFEMRRDHSMATLRELTPDRFEDWCAARFRDLGYEVKSVGGQGDHGIDLIATKDGEKTAVQCRRFAKTRPVSEPQLRDLYGSMHAIGANRAVMVTTGRYTSSARDWARAKPIDLWGPDQLGKAAASTFSVTSGPAPELAPSLGRCPWSDSPLVVRTNRATSEKFIGCSDYPACKYTRPLATRDSRAQRQPPRLG